MQCGLGHVLGKSGCDFTFSSIVSLFVRKFILSGFVGMPLTGDARECNDSNGDRAFPFLGLTFQAKINMMASLYWFLMSAIFNLSDSFYNLFSLQYLSTFCRIDFQELIKFKSKKLT